jgi:hypothetical protein
VSRKGDRGFESFSLQRVVCELSVTERQTISIQSDTRRRGHMTSVHRLLGRRHVRSIRHLRARLIVDACCHAGRGVLGAFLGAAPLNCLPWPLPSKIGPNLGRRPSVLYVFKRYFVEALVGLHQSIRIRTRAREEVWFADDSPLEEAVSSEPVSGAKFPASRETTGNFIDSELSGASTRAKRPSTQCLTSQFPTHPNREFFEALQGIKSGDQGNFFPHQGIRSSSTFLAFALTTNAIVPTDLVFAEKAKRAPPDAGSR